MKVGDVYDLAFKSEVGGGGYDFVIASHDSISKSKDRADFIIEEGEDLSLILNNLIVGLIGVGGKIMLMEGEYNLEHSIVLNQPGITLEGVPGATILSQSDNWQGHPNNYKRKHIIDTWTEDIAGIEWMEVTIKNISVRGNSKTKQSSGFYCVGKTKVINCFSSNNEIGFECDNNSTVINSEAYNSLSFGFRCSKNSKLINCETSNSKEDSFALSDNAIAHSCYARGSGRNGFMFTGNSIGKSCFNKNSKDDGFYCDASSQLMECVNELAEKKGFYCSEKSKLFNCVNIHAIIDGFALMDDSQAFNCHSKKSSFRGFYCDNTSTAKNCVVDTASSVGFLCIDKSQVVGCQVNGMTPEGIVVSPGFKGVVAFNVLRNSNVSAKDHKGIVRDNIEWRSF